MFIELCFDLCLLSTYECGQPLTHCAVIYISCSVKLRSSRVAAWMGGEGCVFGTSMFLPALNVCVGSTISISQRIRYKGMLLIVWLSFLAENFIPVLLYKLWDVY